MVLENNQSAESLLKRIQSVTQRETPDTWVEKLMPESAPAICGWITDGNRMTIAHIQQEFFIHGENTSLMALMVSRDNNVHYLLEVDFQLAENDQILFCGPEGLNRRMQFLLTDKDALSYSLNRFMQEQVILNNS